MISGALTPPEAIAADHVIVNFDSGEPSLDEWLKKRALKNSAAGASRCFVLCSNKIVVGAMGTSGGPIAAAARRARSHCRHPEPAQLTMTGRGI